jgi:hypothetical protein
MMAMNVKASMVMATNSGFNGKSVNNTLTGAVKELAKNSTIRDADEVVLSEAAASLMQSPQKNGEQGSNVTLPMTKRDSGMSV